jgi:hypothetical protein
MTRENSIQIKFVGSKAGTPPKVRLLFDIVLRNGSNKQRWFILPVWITDDIKSSGAGIDGVEVYEMPGNDKAVSVRFQGTGRFQAVLLKAN